MLMKDLVHAKNPPETLIDFLRFTCNELGISTIPKITFSADPISNKESNSFAAYNPQKHIYLYVKHRHILDICRSLAHEMVHYKQDLNDELTPTSGKTGSHHENEANAMAGEIMRKYGKIHPELFN